MYSLLSSRRATLLEKERKMKVELTQEEIARLIDLINVTTEIMKKYSEGYEEQTWKINKMLIIKHKLQEQCH